jgi:hypothetical protein
MFVGFNEIHCDITFIRVLLCDSKLCLYLALKTWELVNGQEFLVYVVVHGRPRQATGLLQPAGLLYRPLWTFQLWPPVAPAPTDAFRTLAAEVGTYGRE